MIPERLLYPLLAFMMGALLLQAGCARPIDTATATANAAAIVLERAHDQMADRYKAEQIAAAQRVNAPPIISSEAEEKAIKAEKRDRVLAVRAKWAGAWAAYVKARASWVAMAASIRVAKNLDDQGVPASLGDVLNLLADVSRAQRELIVAGQALGLFPISETPPEAK